MRKIIWMVIVLFFPFTIKTDATGVSELNYRFDCLATAEPENVIFEMLIKNEGDIPLHFEFPTSKEYEISVIDPSGKLVYLYTKGRYFLQAFHTTTVEPHTTYKRMEKWDYRYDGKRVSKGEYTVNGVYLPTKINDEPVIDWNTLKCKTKMLVPEENTVFRHLHAEGQRGNYLVKGETKTKEFFYTIEDGHKQLVKEQKFIIKNQHLEWEPFSIPLKIPPNQLPVNGTLIMNLYQRDNNGQILNNYPLVLEKLY